MTHYYPTMPVDRSTIKTRIACHPGVLADPAAFILKRNLSFRAAKPTWGRRGGCPCRNIRLDVLTYKGINVELSTIAGDPLTHITIKFNPGVCLYGHNSRVLQLDEFLHALALMANSLKPLLLEPEDWVDLVPGLRPQGVAYWSYLEVLLQLRDATGTLLFRFRHLRHPRITTPSRHWPTSISVGPYRGKLRLSIYLKAPEQHTRGNLSDLQLDEAGSILRLEARMKGDKLPLYFGNDRSVEVIDGKPRLVRFFPEDLVQGHRACIGELMGVFSQNEGSQVSDQGGQLSPLGRLLARVAADNRSTWTFPELLALVTAYLGVSDSTIGKIRMAGFAEMSHLSPISRDELLSDEAYEWQSGIASEPLEQLLRHDLDKLFVHPLIRAAYCPKGQPFRPHVELPSYHR